MPKIQLSEKSDYCFRYQTILKIRDINYANHLSNDAVVSLLNEARMDMFKNIGCTESALGDPGTGIVIADLVVNYKKQGYLGDEIIIHSAIDEIEQKSFRIFYKMEKGDDVMVLAETGVVVYDYQAEHIATVPKVFLKALALLTGDNLPHL